MISVLAQERLLGAALGSLLAGFVIFEQRRCIYKSISGTQSEVKLKLQEQARKDLVKSMIDPREPIFGRKARQEFAHIWNRSVDKTLGPVIESLSSRGW